MARGSDVDLDDPARLGAFDGGEHHGQALDVVGADGLGLGVGAHAVDKLAQEPQVATDLASVGGGAMSGSSAGRMNACSSRGTWALICTAPSHVADPADPTTRQSHSQVVLSPSAHHEPR